MDDKVYHAVADETLEHLHEQLEAHGDAHETARIEVDLGQGVLTVSLRDQPYVVNKQSPNQQLWLSSPISGPMRFNYDAEGHRWLHTRTHKTDLLALLEDEFRSILGAPIALRSIDLGDIVRRSSSAPVSK